MKSIFFVFIVLPFLTLGQTLSYSPKRALNVTIPTTYYNTEYIFMTNVSEQSLSLDFKVLENTLDANWSATICTNMQCLNSIFAQGSLGVLAKDEKAYISINLSANETEGEGQVRFLITSPENKQLSDTVTFSYIVNEGGVTKAQPWARVNFSNGVLTVLLEQAENEADLQVYNLQGKLIYNMQLLPITSLRLADHPKGVYIITIADEKGRSIKKKIANY